MLCRTMIKIAPIEFYDMRNSISYLHHASLTRSNSIPLNNRRDLNTIRLNDPGFGLNDLTALS